jgi:hypothetical protein
LGEIKTIEEINGGDNLIDSKNIDPNKRPSTYMERWNTT